MHEPLDVVVIGGANTDFLVRGAALPRPGQTLEGEEFRQGPGGKGANQAVAAARLGARVAMVARLGSDERGTALLGNLERAGVDIRAVSRDLGAPTGVALIMVDHSGDKQIVTAPGANHELSAREVSDAVELIARAKVLLLQLEVPLDAVGTAVHLGRAAGCRIILDAAPPRHLAEEMLHDLHVIRLNAGEAEALTNVVVKDQTSARRAAENLLHRGVGAAVVAAPGGNMLVSSEGQRWFPHLPVEAVDSTGSGDAFAGALAVALSRGDKLATATRFASAAAALASTRLGAQAGLPTGSEVEQFLRRF